MKYRMNLTATTLSLFIKADDIKRLESYSNNLIDYHMIIDLIPILTKLYYQNAFPNFTLNYTQKLILIGCGLQYKSIDRIKDDLKIQSNQVLSLFNKIIKKFVNNLQVINQNNLDNCTK